MRFARTVFALLACAMAASALPITWTLTGITFDDGGSASGSFTFNPDTGTPCGPFITPCGTYSNINITTMTGGYVTGANYLYACGSDVPTCIGPIGQTPDNTAVLFLTSQAVDQTGLPGLFFYFTPPFAGLTDAGGTIDLSNSSVFEFACADSGCDFPDFSSGSRVGNAGSVSNSSGGLVDSVAPEPSSALLLLGAAVTMLGLGRFRKSS